MIEFSRDLSFAICLYDLDLSFAICYLLSFAISLYGSFYLISGLAKVEIINSVVSAMVPVVNMCFFLSALKLAVCLLSHCFGFAQILEFVSSLISCEFYKLPEVKTTRLYLPLFTKSLSSKNIPSKASDFITTL